jgi:Arc/MetJ family transcription regulator
MLVVALAALVVVADDALPVPNIHQTILQPVRALRVGLRELPDNHFDQAGAEGLTALEELSGVHCCNDATIEDRGQVLSHTAGVAGGGLGTPIGTGGGRGWTPARFESRAATLRERVHPPPRGTFIVRGGSPCCHGVSLGTVDHEDRRVRRQGEDSITSSSSSSSRRIIANTDLQETHGMRTNIVIDDQLMERAQALSGLQTKREAVEEGLRLLVRLKEQEHIRTARGSLPWDGDLDAMRRDDA